LLLRDSMAASRGKIPPEEALMYSYVKTVGVPTLVVREAPAFVVSGLAPVS
jgi:hypothetical protein